MKTIFFLGIYLAAACAAVAVPSTDPIVTAEKYMKYKKTNGHLSEFFPPQIVLVCYQQSVLSHLLKRNPNIQPSNSFSNLYLTPDKQIGILGGWGMGAPCLSIKMEELIILGVKKFIAIGTAGTLMNQHSIGDFVMAPKALAEDGVAHLYLKEKTFAKASKQLLSAWSFFTTKHSLPHFHSGNAWSFSAIFRETPADIDRVTQLGCQVVEMEAATLYAIGQAKGVQALSLFVISDSITQDEWVPHIKEASVRNNLHQLAEWALTFCIETTSN